MFDRITLDTRVMAGRACIRGMRIPVSVIVRQVAQGASVDEILAGTGPEPMSHEKPLEIMVTEITVHQFNSKESSAIARMHNILAITSIG